MALTFEKFIDDLSLLLGMDLKSYKLQRIERRTLSFLRRFNLENYEDLLLELKTDNKKRENFINHVTINTSEFYRNPKSFEILENEILPKLIKEKTPLKIWSAACSDGCEPYTLTLILHYLNLSPQKFSIIATDIDTDIIMKAKEGRYPYKALQNIPKQLLNQYFQKNGDYYILEEKVRNTIRFKQHNLLRDSFERDFDLIVCRNFFIYLERETKEKVIGKFVASLRKNGVLFLGNTEFIVNPLDFRLKKLGASFYLKE